MPKVKQTNTDIRFSSLTDLWYTPQYIFDNLNQEYNFTLDVCATSENTKCNIYFTEEDNALIQEWIGICWMNPPYGRNISKWIKKAYESAQKGATVVCLLPAKTDTAWWHDFITKSSEIRFIKGRLKFGDCANPAPFPSVIVVFRHNDLEQCKISHINRK